jgi:hypothetical protein
MSIRPFQSARERFPIFRGRSAKKEWGPTAYPYPSDKTNKTLGEAEEIEATRQELVNRSDEIRLGNDPYPEKTIRTLGQKAQWLADTAAPAFEKGLTLTETYANIYGGGFGNHPAAQNIGRLGKVVLDRTTPDEVTPYTEKLYKDDHDVQLAAIGHTSPEVPFPAALNQAWTEHNHPLDPLIDKTGQTLAEADKQVAQEKAAAPATGRYDPFADDEESAA